MSYILDALRRADAERAQGAVPNLNAQPLALPVADDDVRSRSGTRWLWLGVGAGLVLAAVGAWQFIGRETPAQRADASPPPAPAAPAPAPAPLPAPAPAPTAATPPPAPARAPEQKPPARRPAPAAAVAPRAEVRALPKPVPPAPAPAPRIPKLAELPAELRAGLPPLGIGGSVYSPQPAARMVIVNGQVLREGDTVAAGLKLEQIRAKSAVFSIRGQSFELPY